MLSIDCDFAFTGAVFERVGFGMMAVAAGDDQREAGMRSGGDVPGRILSRDAGHAGGVRGAVFRQFVSDAFGLMGGDGHGAREWPVGVLSWV